MNWNFKTSMVRWAELFTVYVFHKQLALHSQKKIKKKPRETSFFF